jgi:hypothetical protein
VGELEVSVYCQTPSGPAVLVEMGCHVTGGERLAARRTRLVELGGLTKESTTLPSGWLIARVMSGEVATVRTATLLVTLPLASVTTT